MDTEVTGIRSAAAAVAAPTGSTNLRGLTPIRITLAAGVPVPFKISGSWFHGLDVPVSDLFARFDSGEPVPIRQGVGFERHYTSVELESATGGEVTCLAGFGWVDDGRSTANVNVTANVAPGNTFDNGGDVDVPDGAATKIRDADAATLYVSVTNPSNSPGPVRVGAAGVGISTGQLVEPGVTAPIPFTGDLYAYHENGSDVTLSVAAVQQV